MKKKYICWLLVGTMLMSMVSGCGESKRNVGMTLPIEKEMELEQKMESELQNTGEVDYSGLQDFSDHLLQESFSSANPILSPVSAYLALSLAASGAKGETADEFDAVMGNSRGANSKELMTTLVSDTKNLKLSLANSAWIDQNFKVQKEWLKVATDIYGSDIFQKELGTAKTTGEINKWIEKKTKGLIRDFLQEPLSSEVKLALFNTIYFKGKWAVAFDEQSTCDREFFLENGETIEVPMMQHYDKKLAYVSGDSFDGIALDYQDCDLKFVAIKPTDDTDVRTMYEKLALSDICESVAAARSEQVNLLLPKFKISFDQLLNPYLQNMGLTKAFDASQADFSGIADDLHIDIVRQKAVFILDEEGTEAAAVTAVLMQENCAMLDVAPPREVFFNEPFVYMILDCEKNVPLFVGIMDDPSASEE